MFRRVHGRCWIVAPPGTPASSGQHCRTEDAAAHLLTKRLLAAIDDWTDGRREDIPFEDIVQADLPCWQLSCEGCHEVLETEGGTHFVSQGYAAGAAYRAGWDHFLALCTGCRTLVTPLHPAARSTLDIPQHAS